jgi:hypothetical protein
MIRPPHSRDLSICDLCALSSHEIIVFFFQFFMSTALNTPKETFAYVFEKINLGQVR